MSIADLSKLQAAIVDLEKGDVVSHKLVQYEVDRATYMDATMKFASPYVEAQLPELASKRRLHELGGVLSELSDIDAVWKGNILEHFGHRAFPAGMTLRARKLTQRSSPGSVSEEIVFPRSNVLVFGGRDELRNALQSHAYARPKEGSYTAIDAVTWQGDEIVFLQFTRSRKHGIPMDQLTFYNDLMVAKGVNSNQKKFRFYFIVPSQRYDDYGPQELTVPARMRDSKEKAFYVADIDEKVNAVTNSIEQWVAEMTMT